MATGPPGGIALPRHEDLTRDGLIRRYGGGGSFIDPGWPIIRIEPVPMPRKITRYVANTSLGDLDYFPPEIVREIINNLDTLSLIRFAATCLRAKAELSSLHLYQGIMKHAPCVLAALGATNLLGHFTPATIWQAIQNPWCVSCGCFAPNIFLPSCEKLCTTCMGYNPAYRLITLDTAEECFGLLPDQLEALPLMTRAPRNIAPVTNLEEESKKRFVAVKHAKASSMAFHGWTEMTMEKLRVSTIPASRHEQYFRFLNAPLGRLQAARDSLPLNLRWAIIPGKDDGLFNIACIACPTARDPRGGQERGFRCRGCIRRNERFQNGSLVWNQPLTPLNASLLKLSLSSGSLMAYSTAQFLNHVRKCSWARSLEQNYWGDVPGNLYARLR